MSIDTGVEIGIYLKIKTSKKKTTVHYLMSPETGREFSIEEGIKFCPDSGCKLVEKTRHREDLNSPYAYIEDEESSLYDNEDFWTPEYGPWDRKEAALFLLNVISKYATSLSEDPAEHSINKTVDPAKIISEFEIEYKEHLDFYKKEYGENNVMVKYGIVSYAN